MIIIYIYVLAISIGLFKKFNEPMWKAIVPFVNCYTLYKIVRLGTMSIINNILLIIFEISMTIGSIVFTCWMLSNGERFSNGVSDEYLKSTAITLMTVLTIIFVVVFIILASFITMHIISSIRFAKLFGKDNYFIAGLILLNPIFMGILAYDKSMPNLESTVQQDLNNINQ